MSQASGGSTIPSTVVIINPTAGRGQAGKQVPAIRKLLGPAAAPWTWHYTQARGDAERMAREAAAAGVPLVVAVGGDGTLHEVANGIMGSKSTAVVPGGNLASSTVGLIPFGTGNDLARSMGLHGDLPGACDTLLNGDTIHMDVGCIEGNGTDGERHFLVLAGTGFDARTAQTVNSGIRHLSGAPAYVYGAIVTLAKFEPFDLTLTIDGAEPIRRRAMFCSIANAETTGGGMRIAPGARVDDGRLDICLAEEVSRPTLVYQLTQVFKGLHVRHPAVTMLTGTTITLDADPPQPLLVDGEVIGTTPAKIRLMPGSLAMKVPAAYGASRAPRQPRPAGAAT